MDIENIETISIRNANLCDYPDFTDAVIESARWKLSNIELTENELDILNDKFPDFVQSEGYMYNFK